MGFDFKGNLSDADLGKIVSTVAYLISAKSEKIRRHRKEMYIALKMIVKTMGPGLPIYDMLKLSEKKKTISVINPMMIGSPLLDVNGLVGKAKNLVSEKNHFKALASDLYNENEKLEKNKQETKS